MKDAIKQPKGTAMKDAIKQLKQQYADLMVKQTNVQNAIRALKLLDSGYGERGTDPTTVATAKKAPGTVDLHVKPRVPDHAAWAATYGAKDVKETTKENWHQHLNGLHLPNGVKKTDRVDVKMRGFVWEDMAAHSLNWSNVTEYRLAENSSADYAPAPKKEEVRSLTNAEKAWIDSTKAKKPEVEVTTVRYLTAAEIRRFAEARMRQFRRPITAKRLVELMAAKGYAPAGADATQSVWNALQMGGPTTSPFVNRGRGIGWELCK